MGGFGVADGIVAGDGDGGGVSAGVESDGSCVRLRNGEVVRAILANVVAPQLHSPGGLADIRAGYGSQQIPDSGANLPQLALVLTAAAEIFEEIAEWNAATLEWLASSDRHLTGVDVGGDPDLPEAIVTALKERAGELSRLYAAVQERQLRPQRPYVITTNVRIHLIHAYPLAQDSPS